MLGLVESPVLLTQSLLDMFTPLPGWKVCFLHVTGWSTVTSNPGAALRFSIKDKRDLLRAADDTEQRTCLS